MKHGGRQPAVAILGLGNELLRDDGVGVHAVRELQKDPPEDVVIAEVGTAALNAQHLLEKADVVIAIDAVQAGDIPGTVYRFDVAEAATAGRATLHDLGLVGVLRLMPEAARPEVIVLGVEPERVEYGMELTPAVHAALPRVVGEARRIAEELKMLSIVRCATCKRAL